MPVVLSTRHVRLHQTALPHVTVRRDAVWVLMLSYLFIGASALVIGVLLGYVLARR